MTAPPGAVRTLAPAKLNLSLAVGPVRPDGYHELVSVMVAVDLADELVVRPAPGMALHLEDRVGAGDVLAGDGNLALKAAQLLKQSYGAGPVEIRLRKRIPPAAGLGGGSSDAAATIRALNHLYGLGLSPRQQAALGAMIGSDVPFFAFGGAALIQGRGERVTPLATVDAAFALLLPETRLERKTARMFALLDEQGARPAPGSPPGLACWPRLDGWDYSNDFEAVALHAYPGLAAQRDALVQCGGGAVALSGAGPALFAPCPDRDRAERIAECLQARGLRAMAVAALSSDESRAVEFEG